MSGVAGRINALFATFLRPETAVEDAREWTNVELVRAADSAGDQPPDGRSLSTQYVSLLRQGKREPSLLKASALAAGFAELARLSGTPCEPSVVLTFLGATFGDGEEPTSPEQVRSYLAERADPVAPVSVFARTAGAAPTEDDITALLRAIDTAPDEVRRRGVLRRLLGLGQLGNWGS